MIRVWLKIQWHKMQMLWLGVQIAVLKNAFRFFEWAIGEHRRPDRIIEIIYKNHRGEIARRRIVPLEIHFAASEWHPSEQWLLEAIDLDKDARRSFAMADVLSFGPRPDPMIDRLLAENKELIASLAASVARENQLKMAIRE